MRDCGTAETADAGWVCIWYALDTPGERDSGWETKDMRLKTRVCRHLLWDVRYLQRDDSYLSKFCRQLLSYRRCLLRGPRWLMRCCRLLWRCWRCWSGCLPGCTSLKAWFFTPERRFQIYFVPFFVEAFWCGPFFPDVESFPLQPALWDWVMASAIWTTSGKILSDHSFEQWQLNGHKSLKTC